MSDETSIDLSCPHCSQTVTITTPDASQLESVRPVWDGSAFGPPADFTPFIIVKCNHCGETFTKEF
jgi:ribosomal protein S27E